MDICGNLTPILKIIKYLLNLVQWAIPVILIVLVTMDVFKVVSSGETKDSEKAKSTITKRLIYALVVFLVPLLVKLLFSLVGDSVKSDDLSGPLEWIKCFNSVS